MRKYAYSERYSARGELNHNAKLERSDLPLIKGLLADGLSANVIACKFEVSKATILRVANDDHWICKEPT